MVKKNTHEHDYFKNLKDFLTYHFNKTPGNETKLANVLEYCKLNYKSIGENEVANIEDENVKTLLELRPIHIVHYFHMLAYGLLVRHTNAELAIERLGQVYGVNQPGGLSGFCKRVGRDKNLTKLVRGKDTFIDLRKNGMNYYENSNNDVGNIFETKNVLNEGDDVMYDGNGNLAKSLTDAGTRTYSESVDSEKVEEKESLAKSMASENDVSIREYEPENKAEEDDPNLLRAEEDTAEDEDSDYNSNEDEKKLQDTNYQDIPVVTTISPSKKYTENSADDSAEEDTTKDENSDYNSNEDEKKLQDTNYQDIPVVTTISPSKKYTENSADDSAEEDTTKDENSDYNSNEDEKKLQDTNYQDIPVVTTISPPEKYKNVFFSKPSNGQVSQILKGIGWKQSEDPVQASILWYQKKQFIPWKKLSKWHRPNHLRIERELGHKGKLLDHLLNYEKKLKVKLPFLPTSFRTWLKGDRENFIQTSNILSNETWIVKIPHKDGGKGISMAPPNSPKLAGLREQLMPDNYENSDAKEDELIIQRYVKDIMLYDGHKFDLRIYWAILSINPLIVVYRDGTLRVSLGSYNTKNFTDLKVHLTNAVMQKKSEFYRQNKEKTRVTFPEFQKYLNTKKHQYKEISNSPFDHIKCQVKRALKTIVAAYKDTLSPSNQKIRITENAFSLLGADFMIDNNLNIWITELQSGPGLPKNTQAVAAVMGTMLPELIDIELEIREKQEKGKNLFPLKSLKTFEYIYYPGFEFDEKC
eukprot:g3249.t1